MAQKTCPSCGGSGGYLATERIPNPAGGMFQEIQVRKSCLQCGGMGVIWTQEPASPGVDATTLRGRRTTRTTTTDFETTAAEWLFVAAWGAIAYYGIAVLNYPWYWPVGVGFVVGLLVQKLFAGPLRFLLTGVKYLLLVVLLGGFVAMVVYFVNNSA